MASKILSILAVALLLMGAAAPSTEIEGELEVIVKDFPTHAEHEYSVKDAKGQRHKLKMPRSYRHGDKNLQTGQHVKVKGKKSRAIGGELEVEALEVSAVTAVLPDWLTQVPNPILVMCVSYPDKPAPCTPQSAKTFFEQVVNPFFIQQSGGKMRLRGIKDTASPGDFVSVSVPAGTPGCDGVILAAHEAAVAQGYDTGANPQGYLRKVYLIPSQPCGWAGLAVIGWYGDFAIANGEISCRVICHELGHNLGMYHARCYPDSGQYCDPSDVMGNQSGEFGPFERERLGWLNLAGSPPMTFITSEGDYTFSFYNQQDLTPHGIKLPKAGAPAGTYLFATYRKGIDFSAGKPTAIALHEALETSPGGQLFHAWIGAGEVWSGGDPRFFLNVKSLTATQATVGYSTIPPPLIGQGYAYLCRENEPCQTPTPTQVAFGANNQFMFRSVQAATSFQCDAATFGDPGTAWGVPKFCYQKSVTGGLLPAAPTSLLVN